MDQNNLIQRALKRVRKTASTLGRKIYDDEGFYQRGRLTSKPITQPIQNTVVNNVVKPLTNTLSNTYKPITNYLDPRGYQAERASIRQGGNLGNQKLKSALTAMPNAAFQTFGATRMGLTTPLVSGALGGAIEKATGGNFQEGFRTGVGQSPAIGGFGAITNPAIANLAGRAAARFSTPLTQQLGGRLASGVASIPEGAAISTSLGQKYGPLDASFDFATGALLNKPQARVRVKGSVGNRPNNINPEDLGVSDRIKDFFRSANKDTNPQAFRDAQNMIDDLAGKYLTKQEIDKVVAKGAKTNIKFYEQLNDAIRAKFKNADATYSYADNLALGIKSQGPQQAGEVLKDMKIGQTLEDPIPPGKVPQEFKVGKFNVDENTQELLKDLQQRLGLGYRDVQSFDDMKAIAKDLGTSPQKLIVDIENKRITAGEVVALGDAISTSSQRIQNLTKQLEANPNDIKLKNALEAEESFINKAIKKRIKSGTEAGRAIVAYKIIANNTLDPAFWLDKAQRRLGENKELTAEQIGVINDLIKNQDRIGLATFVANLGESSLPEKVVTLWKAGLLTGFRTQEANIISNAAFGTLETIKDIPATAFDMGRAAITGKPRAKALTPRGVTSQGRGLIVGTKKGMEYIKNGIDPWDADKAEIFTPTRFGETPGGKLAQAYTDTVFRSLGATDRPFREAAFNRSLSEQAALKGINEGMSVKQIEELLKNPTEDMLEAAKQDALYATFNKDNKLSDAIRAGKRAGGGAVRTATDIIAPFTRTPTNVAEALFDYTPAGIIKDIVKKIINKESVSDKRLAESFGRSVTGTALLWAGYELAKRGLVSGSYPASEAERSQKDLENKPNNAIFINGKWRVMGRVSPIGNLLLLGADAYNNGLDIAATGVDAAKSLTEQTFLKGVSSGLKAINEPDRYAASFVENSLAGFVPSLLNDIARGTDTVVRDTDGLRQRLKARIPGLRQQLPTKPNALGEDIQQEGGLLGSMFDPFNSRTPSDDPLVKEMSRVGYNLNVVGDTLNEQKLTQAEKIEYQRRAGKYIREFLPQVINAEGYQELDKETQKSIIEKTVNKAKDVAREEIKPLLGTIESEEKSIIGQVGAAEQPVSESETKELGNVFSSDTSAKRKLVAKDVDVSTTEKEGKPTSLYVYTDPDTLTTQTLNLSKVLNMPEKTSTDRIKKENEAYKLVDKAISSSLSDQQKAQIIKDLKLDAEDVKYYLNAKETEEVKTAMIQDRIDRGYDSDEALWNDLVSWKRPVNGKIFLSDGVIDDLEDQGLLTDAEAKYLKKLEIDPVTGEPKLKGRLGKGTKAKLKLSGINTNMSNLKAILRAKPASIDTARLRIQEPQRAKLPQIYQFPQSLL